MVSGLSYWSYYKDAGNIWVWLFIPIVIISFFIPLFERLAVKKDTNMMADNFNNNKTQNEDSNKRF